MKECKLHDMENVRMENAHLDKDRIYHTWKKAEKAHMENERMKIARHEKFKN